jgi:sulfite exporter TauE/SafE
MAMDTVTSGLRWVTLDAGHGAVEGWQNSGVACVTLKYIITQLVTLAIVGGIMGLVAWVKIPRATPPLDEAEVMRRLAEDFPQTPLDQIWLALDGAGAVARSGDLALLLFRMGDSYVSRSMAWSQALQAQAIKGRFWFRFNDFAAPKASLALAPNWAMTAMGETN